MQGLWYGDKRDRVKWGALIHLADREKIPCIVQVAYFRHGKEPMLQTDEGEVRLPDHVWDHLSDLRHIEHLGKATGFNIIVLDQYFEQRRKYIHIIVSHLKEIKGRKIIFLDPDTGIEPGQSSSPKHVKKQDMEEIWAVLSRGDLLVIYQHADRTKKWLSDRKKKMSDACDKVAVGTITGSGIASDVAMLWCRKDSTAKLKSQEAYLEPIQTSKKEKVPRPCACQCGRVPRTRRGYFCQGHDAKLKSKFLKVSRGEMAKKDLDKIVLKMYEIWSKDKSRPLLEIAKEVLD